MPAHRERISKTCVSSRNMRWRNAREADTLRCPTFLLCGANASHWLRGQYLQFWKLVIQIRSFQNCSRNIGLNDIAQIWYSSIWQFVKFNIVQVGSLSNLLFIQLRELFKSYFFAHSQAPPHLLIDFMFGYTQNYLAN